MRDVMMTRLRTSSYLMYFAQYPHTILNVISILVATPVNLIGLVKQKQLHKPNPNELDDVLKTLRERDPVPHCTPEWPNRIRRGETDGLCNQSWTVKVSIFFSVQVSCCSGVAPHQRSSPYWGSGDMAALPPG